MQWLLSRGRWPFIFLVGATTLFFGYHCLYLEVDRDNRSMDADNAAQKAVETEFQEIFDERDSILVAIDQGDSENTSGGDPVEEIVSQLQEIDGIEKVIRAAEGGSELLKSQRGLLISEDGSVVALRLVLEPLNGEGEQLSELIEEVKSLTAKYTGEGMRVAVTGLPIQKFEVGELLRRDQKMFAPLSLLVLGLVLVAVTRRFSGMIFPLLVSVITICWTLGVYSLFGNTLNVITSLLPPVIMTISVATTIHIYLDWLHETETDHRKRVLKAVGNLYRPCLFASLTTAIGFLSLLLSETPAVRLFGLFAALGVSISYLLGVIGIAVGLSFLKPPKNGAGMSPLEHLGAAHRMLDRIAEATVNHPKKIICCALVIAIVGVIGAKKVETDTDILHFLGKENPVRVDTEFIDDHLAGISVVELFLKQIEGDAIESSRPLAELQVRLRSVHHVRKVFGLPDLLPEVAVTAEENGVPLSEILTRIDAESYLNETRTAARISVFTDSIGTREGKALVEELVEIVGESMGDGFEVYPVGEFYRVITESTQLVESQLKSFLVAIVLILIAIGIVFRSFVYALLAIIPNVVPLLLAAAVMGYFGIALSTGTAMIASVVIGIAVDDTIHYLSAYRKSIRLRRAGAIRKTTGTTGFVLLSTTLALSAGFWVALLGSFQPTIYFAMLAGLTMWFALICDLLVLPACLRLASPDPRPSDKLV